MRRFGQPPSQGCPPPLGRTQSSNDGERGTPSPRSKEAIAADAHPRRFFLFIGISGTIAVTAPKRPRTAELPNDPNWANHTNTAPLEKSFAVFVSFASFESFGTSSRPWPPGDRIAVNRRR